MFPVTEAATEAAADEARTMFLTGGDEQARRVSGDGLAFSPDGAPRPVPPPAHLRALLADPDTLARRHLRQLLADEPHILVVAECETGGATLAAALHERPDLVFLEVVLPDADGFILARELRPYMRGLIFVTDRPQGALEAFQVHALDYLLKPVGPDRLQRAVAHARSLLLQDGRDLGVYERLVALLDQRDAERQRRTRLLIRHPDGAFFIKTDAIDWVEAAGKLVRVHAGKQVYAQREALARIERHLDHDQFLRISRSAIVNIDRIREIQPWFNGERLVVLDDDSQVPTSRHYRANLRRLLGGGDEP
jgi:two-component system LytT family response regulator